MTTTPLADLTVPTQRQLDAANFWNSRICYDFLSNLLIGVQGLAGAGGTQADLIFDPATTLTIATGAIVVAQGSHKVDTEGAAASDDLDTITGGTAEEELFLRPANAARTVVIKHGIGADKIACPGAADISLAEATDWAALMYNGTQWVVLASSTLAPVVPDTAVHVSTAAGTGASGATAPAFVGTDPAGAVVDYAPYGGTGFATVGQVVTTTENKTLAENELANCWLITATQAPCLIAGNPAVSGAPAVLTVFGAAPVTSAEAYKILYAPTPTGTVASHTHTGPSHTH